jgi:alpha 1,2-mannosyltransferase
MRVNSKLILAATASLAALTILLNILMIKQNNREQGPVNIASSNFLNLESYKFDPSTEDKISSSGTDVIVYLAQFAHHSTYGEQNITGASKLEKSLDTLYANYLNEFPCDVIVFYGEDNEPDPDLFKKLQTGRPRLYFRQLNGIYWELPHGLRAQDKWRWTLPGYSIGYRHMIRWYAYLIWPYLTSLGYTHVMRMDDDSYIHSSIKYNIFDYMRNNNKRYGFRQPCMDSTGEEALSKVVLDYLEKESNLVTQERLDDFNKLRYLGFYNNWFVADMSFFLEPPVSTLLQIIDESKIMYEFRSNDLLIQSVLVRLFLEPTQVKWFDDFTYEHVTDHGKNRPRNAGCPSFGGLSYGYGHDANEWEALSKAFIDRYPSYCVSAVGSFTSYIN